MTLVLDPRQLAAIRHHGEADYPAEACGLIGGDPLSFRRAQERLDRDGLEVIGVYHSHPDHPPAPSAFDRDHAWPWLSYVIVGVGAGHAGDPKSWVLADDRGTFAEESITIEERKAVWQSPY